MNVNGFSTVSHPSTSGTFTPSSPPAGTPPLRTYDCLWDYAPYPPAGAGGLKDGSPAAPPLSGLGQFPLNGVAGGSRPASPGHGTNLRGAGQEFWGNGTPGPMGLNFDSQELYDSFHDQSFELMQNGPASFYTAAQPSPMLGSGTQPFSLPPGLPEEPGAGEGDADAAAKEIPPAIAENGGGLVGSMELEEAQPGRSPALLVRASRAPGCGAAAPAGGCWILSRDGGVGRRAPRGGPAPPTHLPRVPAEVWPVTTRSRCWDLVKPGRPQPAASPPAERRSPPTLVCTSPGVAGCRGRAGCRGGGPAANCRSAGNGSGSCRVIPRGGGGQALGSVTIVSCCHRVCFRSIVPFRLEDLQLQRVCPRRGAAWAGESCPGPRRGQQLPGGHVAHRPSAGGRPHPQRRPPGAL